MQVGDAVAFDDSRVFQEELGAGVVAEEGFAGAEDDRDEVVGEFVDQAGSEGLAGQGAGGQGDVSVAG